MGKQALYDLFVDQLEDMCSAENQLVEAIPLMIKHASYPELKEALTDHLEETKNQVTRLKTIFSLLKIKASQKVCEAMKGLIKEAKELLESKGSSAVVDAAIICAAQKVEHYEIASYGTLCSFAKHLELDSEIIDLIKDSLKEEGNADKQLTKIADGSFFSSGVNKEAVTTHR